MPLDLDALVLGPCFAIFGEGNRGFTPPYYAPQAGAGFTVEGVFRLPSFDVLRHLDEPGLTTRKPELDLRLSQFPPGVAPLQRDRVVVRGILYAIADVRPDGVGLVTLELSESADAALPAASFLPVVFVGGFMLFTDADGDFVIQAPDGSLSVVVENPGPAPLVGVAAPPGGVQVGLYALYQDDGGNLVIEAPDGGIEVIYVNTGPVPSGGVGTAGLAVGDYRLLVVAPGSLTIEAPDGALATWIAA